MSDDNTQSVDWSSMVRTDAGVPEVDIHWVHQNLGKVHVVDVREDHELTGPLGHIEGITHVPLGQIEQGSADWDKSQGVVILCRSGGRSGRAALWMENNGFTQVVSMAGGMIKWNEADLPKAQ